MKTLYISINTEKTGKNIKRIMDQRGYTVKDIQTSMGFENPQAVYKWLAGQSMPTIDNLVILSRVLEVSLDEIPVIDGDFSILNRWMNDLKIAGGYIKMRHVSKQVLYKIVRNRTKKINYIFATDIVFIMI